MCEIYGIERKLNKIHQSKKDADPPRIEKALHAETVPTKNGVRTSSRKKSRPRIGRARKGVEPKGENLTIWKSKQRMQEIF